MNTSKQAMLDTSALTAGYAHQSAVKYSSGLLKNPDVQAYIQERMAEIKTNAIADQQEMRA